MPDFVAGRRQEKKHQASKNALAGSASHRQWQQLLGRAYDFHGAVEKKISRATARSLLGSLRAPPPHQIGDSFHHFGETGQSPIGPRGASRRGVFPPAPRAQHKPLLPAGRLNFLQARPAQALRYRNSGIGRQSRRENLIVFPGTTYALRADLLPKFARGGMQVA